MPNEDFWLKLLEPGTIAAIVAGICTVGTTLIAAWRNNKTTQEVAQKLDRNTAITQEGVRKVEEVKSVTAAAATIAKRAENKAAEAAQITRENHEANAVKLDKVVHELNGGFSDKVRQAMSPHVEETQKRFDHLERKVQEILSAVKPSPNPGE